MQYQAKFTPTVEDVLTGYYLRCGRSSDFAKTGFLVGCITTILIFGIAAYFLHSFMFGVSGMFIGVGASSGGFLAKWKIRRQAKNSKFEELTFLFSEEGVDFSNSTTQAKYTWNEIKKTRLDERGVVLDFGPLGYLFIPARAFFGDHFPLQELKLLSHKK